MESKRPSQEPIVNTVSLKEKAVFIGSVTLLATALAVTWQNDQNITSSIIDTLTSHRVNASVIDISHTYNPRNIQMGTKIDGCQIGGVSNLDDSPKVIIFSNNCDPMQGNEVNQTQ